MRPGFAVRIEADAAAEEAIVCFLGRDRGQRWLTEAVCDFIEEAAKVMVEHGEVDYELVMDTDTDSAETLNTASPRTARRHLELIPPRSLNVLGPLAFQFVREKAMSSRLIRVPRRKLFRMKLPRSLGSVRSHRRMLRRLDELEQTSRRFEASMTTSAPKGYDHRAAQRAGHSQVIRVTRRWGVLYFLEPKDMTGYFSVAGAVCHRRAQAILRDHIVDQLNALLRAEGLAQLLLEGLPSAREIELTLADLAAGDIDLKQASETTQF
jgi:hypothetical protein